MSTLKRCTYIVTLLTLCWETCSACLSSSDCSLNGDCISGHCVCDSGWRGLSCSVLDLKDADISESYIAPNGTSSWGLSLAYDDSDNLWHGFVSEFANQCKLSSWTTNSFINHIVARRPEGPWEQHAIAVSAWAHNPKIVFSAQDRMWLLYHIGLGEPKPLKDCRGGNAMDQEPSRQQHSTAPLTIHYSKSLNGSWERAEEASKRLSLPPETHMTLYPDIANGKTQLRGQLLLFEKTVLGSGKAAIPLSRFAPNPHRAGSPLAFDTCSSELVFDNGHALHDTVRGSSIGAIALTLEESDGISLLAGSPCDQTYRYPNVTFLASIGPGNGTVYVSSVDYFELVIPDGRSGPKFLGVTEDAAGCRGACEAFDAGCTSFTWTGTTTRSCYGWTDWHWLPQNSTGATSGRPWPRSGDNPSPWIDQESGEVRVMYRTDSRGGNNSTGGVASLIGQLSAAHWSGPYEMLSSYGGPISSPQYPFEENEDPFLWRSKRGWHALFHSCTWGDSRGKIWPVESWAGRHGFSKDGVSWQFSPEPAYNGTVRFANGTVSIFARRERPFLVLDSDGLPTHLFTGVQRYDWDDYTFSLLQGVQRPTLEHLYI